MLSQSLPSEHEGALRSPHEVRTTIWTLLDYTHYVHTSALDGTAGLCSFSEMGPGRATSQKSCILNIPVQTCGEVATVPTNYINEPPCSRRAPAACAHSRHLPNNLRETRTSRFKDCVSVRVRPRASLAHVRAVHSLRRVRIVNDVCAWWHAPPSPPIQVPTHQRARPNGCVVTCVLWTAPR